MSVNIFGSRRQYHERCRYWKVDEDFHELEKLKHRKRCDGIFYAKEIDNTFNADDLDSNIVFVDNQNTYIETEDDIYNLEPKDLVEFAGEIWIVVSIKSTRNNNASYFQRKPRRKWFIEIRNGE